MDSKDFYGYTIYSNGDIKGLYNKMLKQRIRGEGKDARSEIKLSIDGKRKNFVTARLIYCVFNDIDIFKLDKDQCVTFKDGDKLNTDINNLELVYRGDLIQGSNHESIAKLDDEQVNEIRAKYESTKDIRPVNQHDAEGKYHSYRSLAKEYGVTHAMIRHIIVGSARDENKYKLKEDENAKS